MKEQVHIEERERKIPRNDIICSSLLTFKYLNAHNYDASFFQLAFFRKRLPSATHLITCMHESVLNKCRRYFEKKNEMK